MGVFRWNALEQGGGDGLEVYRGTGGFGVTTLKISKLTREYFVTLFEAEADAIIYARQSVFKGKLFVDGGKVQYVVQVLGYDTSGRRILLPRFRILKVVNPVLDESGRRPPGPIRKEEKQILVLKNAGASPAGEEDPSLIFEGKGIRWQPAKYLTVMVPDYEEELAKAAAARGTKEVRTGTGVPSGSKTRVEPKLGKAGPARIPTSPGKIKAQERLVQKQEAKELKKEMERLAASEVEQRRAAANALVVKVTELREKKDSVEAMIMRAGGASKAPAPLVAEREALIEYIDELETRIAGLS